MRLAHTLTAWTLCAATCAALALPAAALAEGSRQDGADRGASMGSGAGYLELPNADGPGLIDGLLRDGMDRAYVLEGQLGYPSNARVPFGTDPLYGQLVAVLRPVQPPRSDDGLVPPKPDPAFYLLGAWSRNEAGEGELEGLLYSIDPATRELRSEGYLYGAFEVVPTQPRSELPQLGGGPSPSAPRDDRVELPDVQPVAVRWAGAYQASFRWFE